jgi:pimeloyl-ACP methyl ester carboxylesterase
MRSTEGYVTVEDGVRLFYQTVGNAPEVLLLINGFYLFDDFKYLGEGRTIISLDLRNRGRSDYIVEDGKLQRGIQNDIDDIEAVRRHFGLNRIDLLAHSYAGKTVMLYAMKYPACVRRVVQIGPIQPDESKKYPAHLTNSDATLHDFFAKMAALEQQRQSLGSLEFCNKFWSLLQFIYLVNPDHAAKLHWNRCNLPTELNCMAYWMKHLLPSIQAATPTTEDSARATMPVLIVHGTKDRSSPYGGGREWARILPNARLLSVENTAHVPWIEAPDKVLDSIRLFLNGDWPNEAERVSAL